MDVDDKLMMANVEDVEELVLGREKKTEGRKERSQAYGSDDMLGHPTID